MSSEQRRTVPVELLWDLVFVFAVTQVTSLLYHQPTWSRFGQAMLVLALVWWAWSAFVWAANAQDESSAVLRGSLLLASLFIFIAGLALPQAFGGEATLFATCYALVRFLHLALYIDASRRGNASFEAIAGFSLTVTAGMTLLIGGSFAGGALRTALWALAVAIDYAGPAWLTRERLRGLQQVAVEHFAERYGLFVIICLGESIVAIGVGAASRRIDASLVASVALGLLITVGLWWTYFDRFAAVAEARLRTHEDPVLAAADAYSYIHLILVAGIITLAVGLRSLTHAASQPLAAPARLALCGGIAIYLLGHLGFRWRITGQPAARNAVTAAACLVLYALTSSVAGWGVAAVAALLLGALCLADRLAERHAPA